MLSLGRLLPRPIAQHPTVSRARVLDASNDDQTDTSSSFPSRYAQYRSGFSLLSYCSYTLLGRPVGPAPVDSLRSRRLSAIFEPRSFPPFHLSCRPYPKTIRPSHRPLSPFQSYSTVF